MYLYALTIISMVFVLFTSIDIGFLSIVLARLFNVSIEIKYENYKTV